VTSDELGFDIGHKPGALTRYFAERWLEEPSAKGEQLIAWLLEAALGRNAMYFIVHAPMTCGPQGSCYNKSMTVQPSGISNADIVYYASALMVYGGFNIMLLGPVGIGKTRAVKGLEAFLNEAYPNDKLAQRVFTLNASHALDSAAVHGVVWAPEAASWSLDQLSQNITRTDEKHARGQLVIDRTVYALYTQDLAHSNYLKSIGRKAQPGHDTVVLLLDELLTAPRDVQKALLSLVSHRTILGHTIKNPLTIVATGNPPSETNILSSVLALPAHRRFLVFTFSHTTLDEYYNVSAPLINRLSSHEKRQGFLANSEPYTFVANHNAFKYSKLPEIDKIMKCRMYVWMAAQASLERNPELRNFEILNCSEYDIDMERRLAYGEGIDTPSGRHMLYDALGIAIAIDSEAWFREMLIRAAVGPTAAQAMLNCKIFGTLRDKKSADAVREVDECVQMVREKMIKIEEENNPKKEMKYVKDNVVRNAIWSSYGHA